MYSSDIWFISYLLHRGHQIVRYDVIGKGKVKCMFAISEDEWRKLRLEYDKSVFSECKALHERIKDLAY